MAGRPSDGTVAVIETAEVVVNLGSELGEGPIWDARSGRLVWIDILGRRIHRTHPASGLTESIETPSQVGSVAVRAGGGFVAALADGFWVADPGGAWRQLATVEADRPDLRFNDGKCDPSGRFWAGSMAHDARPGAGALYRLEPDGTVSRALAGVTISNGLAWSPDGRTMYYIDTPTQRVDALSFDLVTGAVSGRRSIVRIPADMGSPDGMTVDAEGGLWIALWGGSAVHRYVDGRLAQVVRLPVSQPTSCAFGGPDLDELYITSAWEGLSVTARGTQPLAGAIFRARPGVRGLPAAEFLG